MSMSDPVADMLTRVRNALSAGHDVCEMPASRLKHDVGELLKREGFIRDCAVEGEGVSRTLKLTLKYFNQGQPAIRGLKRISKGGLRKFSSHADLPRVLDGMGVAILTTSKGVMTDNDARKAHVGGEVMCYVW